MNRYLLAGCAAAALALGAGAANAQAKFEVKVGGDAYFEAGYVDEDLDANKRNTEFRNRFRLVVTPSAKADNGLEYGARIRIRSNASNGTLDADRAYMFVQGGFGQVQLGRVNSYNDQTGLARPISWQPFGNYDFATNWDVGNMGAGAWGVNNGSVANPLLNADRLGSKIVYISPRFAGLQGGVSYTPRTDSSNAHTDRTKRDLATVGIIDNRFQDLVEVGANYTNNFGGVDLKASAGYMWGENKNRQAGTGASYEDLRAWQVGAQVGYAGFVVGGGYTDLGDSGQLSGAGLEDAKMWNVGAQYTTGPLVVGVGYTNTKDGISATADRTVNLYDVGVGYTVAPGLTVQAQYSYVDIEVDGVAGQDNEANVFLVRTLLAF